MTRTRHGILSLLVLGFALAYAQVAAAQEAPAQAKAAPYIETALKNAVIAPVRSPDARPARPLNRPLRRGERDRYFRTMLEGSFRVSRTTYGRRSPSITPPAVGDGEIAALAARNFRAAAKFVLENAHRLDVSRATAMSINRRLTRGLVAEVDRGTPDFRRDSDPFYRWLESPAAKTLGRQDPVALAEQIHRTLSGLDAFPDGNGRTARLMADLTLIKAGRAPALYTAKDDYFARGNARSDVPIEAQARYFREIVARGEAASRSFFGRLLAGDPPAALAP